MTRGIAADDTAQIDAAVASLVREFRGVPHDTVVSMLTDAYQLVIDNAGAPLVERAVDLTRIRLELKLA